MALSLGFAGCGFSAQLGADEVPPEAGSNDGGPDARPLDGCTTFSTVVDTCMVGAYGPGLTITGNRRYDTVSHTLADDPSGNNATTPMFFETTIGGNPITLVVVDGFAIDGSAKLRVTGARAFGVVSTAAIQIMGTLDGTNGGAGARSLQTCINAGSQGRDGADNNAGSGGASGGGQVLQLVASNIAFQQTSLDAPAGQPFTIHFNNQDSVPHNVVIKDGSGNAVFTGQIVTGPAATDYAVPALPAGSYTFNCAVHPNMTGTITVH